MTVHSNSSKSIKMYSFYKYEELITVMDCNFCIDIIDIISHSHHCEDSHKTMYELYYKESVDYAITASPFCNFSPILFKAGLLINFQYYQMTKIIKRLS